MILPQILCSAGALDSSPEFPVLLLESDSVVFFVSFVPFRSWR